MGEGKSGLLIPFAVFIVIILLIGAVFATGIPASSEWEASNTSPGNVVIATGTWTTTNEYGVTVTYSGTYTSTMSSTSSCVWPWCQATTTSSSTSSSTTTSTAGTPWIRLTFHGTYQITDKDGVVVYTNTFEWAPIGGSGNGTHIKYSLDYTVEGAGVDWSTLVVNVNVKGLTAQPSVADPNTPEILNTVDNVDSVADAKTQNGHLGKIVPIDTLIGGKTVDKKRVLTPSISVTGTANAKVLPGYSLAGGNMLGVDVGPVVGVSNMNWKDPSNPPAPPTPAYTSSVAERSGSSGKEPKDIEGGGDWGGSNKKSGFENAGIKTIGGHYSLLGINQAIDIFGAELDTSFSDTTFLGLVAALVVVTAIIISAVIVSRKKH